MSELLEKGDLVACYLLNSDSAEEALMQYGIVLDVNESLRDVLVLDNAGDSRWWPRRRWRLLQKNKKKG